MLEQKIISKNLKALRKSLGDTQEEFAERCDISLHTVGNSERGVYIPSSETLAKISNATGVSISDLIYEKKQGI